MTTRISLTLAALVVAAPAAAQTVVDSTTSDLNRDGIAERFTLLDYGNGSVDLIIDETGQGRTTVPAIAWMGGIGQAAELKLASNGSVMIQSRNESIGRNRWFQALTIAHRDGAYRVVGFTFDHYDTLNLDAGGTCDLNLLNGKGFVGRPEEAKQPIRHDVPALPVTEWSQDTPIPEVCRTWE